MCDHFGVTVLRSRCIYSRYMYTMMENLHRVCWQYLHQTFISSDNFGTHILRYTCANNHFNTKCFNCL